MNIMIWVITGFVAAWVGLNVFHINEDRGLVVSGMIGAVGAVIGGHTIAPMLSGPATEPVIGLSPFVLIVALATAALCLLVSNFVVKRYGI